MRRVPIVVGYTEALLLVVFATAIVVNANRVHSTVGKPVASAIIFVLFAILIAAVTRALQRGSTWAQTPYFLIQIFATIVGYTLASGSWAGDKVIGLLIITGAVTAANTSRRSL